MLRSWLSGGSISGSGGEVSAATSFFDQLVPPPRHPLAAWLRERCEVAVHSVHELFGKLIGTGLRHASTIDQRPNWRQWGWLAMILLVAWPTAVLAEMPRAAAPYRDDVIRAARLYLPQVPVPWFAGQIHQESRWDARARSPVGAAGLLQIMPATAGDIARTCGLPGFDPLNPRQAIRGGACYDAWLWGRVGRVVPGWARTPADHWTLTTRAYNGGLGWIQREASRWVALGLQAGPAVWLGAICPHLRAAWACQENLEYPQQIQRWARLYVGWE